MGSTLTAYRDRVQEMVMDTTAGVLTNTDAEAAVKAAFRTHSRNQPRRQVNAYSGDGSTFEFTVPSDWDESVSTILDVEFPTEDRQPVFLDPKSYGLIQDADDQTYKLRLFDHTPTSGETLRVHYVTAWPLPGTAADTDKLPDSDFDGICYLATSFACDALAKKFARSKDPGLGADAAVRDQQLRFRQETKAAYELYRRHFGIPDGEAPAGTVFDWDAEPSWDTPIASSWGDWAFRNRR